MKAMEDIDMNDMTPTIGHNNPPDPIDAINEAYTSEREESENWTDGTPVENDAQMDEVDKLRKAMQQCRLELEAGQEIAVKPLRDATTAERDRWKPTIADAKRIETCLVKTVDAFKQQREAKRVAAERAAWEETNRLRREAEESDRKAGASNLEAQRESEAAKQAVLDAEKAARVIAKDTTKGMRTVKETVVLDAVNLARHLWEHDREAQLAFQADRARKLGLDIAGVVEIRTKKVAY